MWFAPMPGQGVITVYGFFTPLRIAIKCFRASHISAEEVSRAILRADHLRTSIHVGFTELA
jgi:hypothetical protein